MPSKQYPVNYLNKRNTTEEVRRQMAELRVCYGNALSNFNLRRMRGDASTAQTCRKSKTHYDRVMEVSGPLTNAYSWQLRDLSVRRLSLPPLTAATAPPPSLPIAPWEPPRYIRNVNRCYRTLQRQAAARTKLAAAPQQSPAEHAQKKQVNFMVTYRKTREEPIKKVENPKG